MRMVVANALGPASQLALQVGEIEEPGHGEALIAVRVASVSYVDDLIVTGTYQVRPPLPFTPGSEFAGIVAAVGPGVDSVAVGDRVCCSGLGGGWADYAIVPMRSILKLPDQMDFREGAAFKVAFSTAYYALVQKAQLQRGETVLVLGASGAIGHAAIQIAKVLGAVVIAAISTGAKQDFAREAGADHFIDVRSGGWHRTLSLEHGLQSVDVVFDPVGGNVTETAFRMLGWGGRHLIVGFATGEIPSLRTNLALLKGAMLIGVDIRQFHQREPQLAVANQAILADWYQAGRIKPAVGPIFPLDQFSAALLAAREPSVCGRVQISIGSQD